MKKVIDNKTGKVAVVFNEYKLGTSQICPECKRAFKDYDNQRLKVNGYTRCPKCGAKLSK